MRYSPQPCAAQSLTRVRISQRARRRCYSSSRLRTMHTMWCISRMPMVRAPMKLKPALLASTLRCFVLKIRVCSRDLGNRREEEVGTVGKPVNPLQLIQTRNSLKHLRFCSENTVWFFTVFGKVELEPVMEKKASLIDRQPRKSSTAQDLNPSLFCPSPLRKGGFYCQTCTTTSALLLPHRAECVSMSAHFVAPFAFIIQGLACLFARQLIGFHTSRRGRTMSTIAAGSSSLENVHVRLVPVRVRH